MKFSVNRMLTIARREYVTTVKRKAFLVSVFLTPALIFFSTFVSGKLASDDTRAHQRLAKIVAVVDSSGLYANAERSLEFGAVTPAVQSSGATVRVRAPRRETVPVVIRPFATQAEALDSLAAGTVNVALVIAPDFLETGRIRRYEHDTRVFTSSGDDRALRFWLTRNLLAGHADSSRVERAWLLSRAIDLYVPARDGGYELKDDTRELTAFLLPFLLGMVLSIAIITGGQYLLQGVSEEKESRILESLVCTVSPDELMGGKLIGLGGAGLTLVGIWLVVAIAVVSTSFAFLKIELPASLAVLGVLYFLGGYLFYASVMTGIGGITNNLREAQQFAMALTIANFFPFYVLVKILNSPNSGIAVGMSLFPPTAATTMMMRLSAGALTGAVIPLWQIALSLGILALSGVVALVLSARLFRLGLLMYGKTPTLPEILKLLRQG
jgi:ABC-2 type transport system permease protein